MEQGCTQAILISYYENKWAKKYQACNSLIKNSMNIEDLQNICKIFLAVTEDIKWGHDLVFSIGAKMFCVVGLDESPTTASFKVREEEFDEICNREGFKPAPYVAKHKWVMINDINKMNKKEWKHYTRQSYELVKDKLPVKTKRALGLLN